MWKSSKIGRVLYRVVLLAIIVLGYVYLSYYWYKGYLNLNQFVAVTSLVILLVPALVLLTRVSRLEPLLPEIHLGRIVYALPYLVFLCAFLETRLFGHMGFFTVITLIGGFAILLFSRLSSIITPIAASLLAMIICVLYGIYTPSFGSDTWRDAIQATQIIARGGLEDLTIVHQAYPIPVVSLLYAMQSIVTGLDTLWSSSVLGLLYLLLLVLWVYTLAKRANARYPHVAVILALTTPLVVVWSVWFIPQVYSLLVALPVLFLDLHLAVLVVLTLALVLGHGGLALWALTILMILALTKRILRVRVPLNLVEVRLAIVTLVFTLYAAYTTLSVVLKGATSGIIEALMAFLSGERVLVAAAPIQTPPIAVLGVIPVAVLATLGLVVLVEGRDAVRRLLAFTSLIGLGIAYVGAVAYPALDLPRYLGLGSTVMLAVLSPQAVQVLAKRGRLATYYTLSIILLAVVSFGFAGTLMPENPYTANPYAIWSTSGLITYDEAKILNEIGSLLCCNNYLVDWRAGAYLYYKYLWIQPLYRGFYYPEAQSVFTLAGSYGLYITAEYFIKYEGVFIFRVMSLRMIEAFSPNIEHFLYSTIHYNTSMLYDSALLKIYHFT